jgi:signal transduction histidine kinase
LGGGDAKSNYKKIGDRLWQFVTIPLRQNSTNVEEKSIRVSEWEHLQHYNTTTPLHSLSPDLSLVMATDVTEQHIFAKELAAKNADLVQLNRMKDEFLACISHELKTPLTSVLGLASLLKDQLIGQLNERQARYARLIHQSGRQLMTVVNDILDLTRMETGQLELTPEPVHIPTVCDRAITQARQLQPGKEPLETDLQQEEISFTLSIEPELETMVADELRLRQMLSHLLSNALKFTESGGAIGLKVACWEGWIALLSGILALASPKQNSI